MSYLTFVALMLLVVSPVLIPLVITGAHQLTAEAQAVPAD
jgi:hypothetical protein